MSSVITCKKGDTLVVTESFEAGLSGTGADRLMFTVGQRVKFSRIIPSTNCNGQWLVEFIDRELFYAVLPYYFVTEGAWEEIAVSIISKYRREMAKIVACPQCNFRSTRVV